MKISILLPSLLVLAGATVFAADPDPKDKLLDQQRGVVANVDQASGKVTVTIDMNGKKVTREIDLSKAQQLNIGDVVNNLGDVAKPKPQAEVRTWLGVATDEPSDEVRAQISVAPGTGLLVREVIGDSPAAKAGLEKNDILTRLDDQILTNPEQLRTLIGIKKAGDTIHVTYLRKGQESAVEVKLAAHAEEDATGLLDRTRKLLLSTLAINNVTTASNVSGANEGNSINANIVERNATFDKDGNLYYYMIPWQSDAGKDGAPAKEQWHLYFNGAHADVTEAMKQLEKSLHDAGLNDEAIGKTRQVVAEAIGQIQKAVSEANGSKDEIARNAQKAVEELRRAIENAWRPEEGEASKLPQTPRLQDQPQIVPKKAP